MRQTRATDPQNAYWAFDPFALVKPGEPWFEDLSASLADHRYGLGARLSKHLQPAPNAPDFVQVAILGQSGVGKTTQVHGAIGKMPKEEIFPVVIDALTELDPADLDFADILFTLARSVLVELQEHEIDVPSDAAELLETYFADETYVKTTGHSKSAGLEIAAEASGGVLFIGRLLGRFQASMKAESDYRREIRRVVQRDPKELIRRVNFLLDEATKAVRKRLGKQCRLLVVIDNLEKFEQREIVERAVISRASELRDLRCHLVAFLHPADLYAPRTISASAAFQKVICVPALPVRERADAPDTIDPACIKAVRALLERRVEVDAIFEDGEAAVTALLQHSGGHLRDLLAIAREACELFTGSKVGLAEIDAAARSLSRIHNAKIRPGDWQRLHAIAETKDIVNDQVDAYLLLHLLVLEYNGETWWDVHPFVRLDRRFDPDSPPSQLAT